MKFLFKHPVINIGIVVLITAFFLWWLPKIIIDNDISKMMPEDHPANEAMTEFSNQFGSSDSIFIGLEVNSGTVFTVETLQMMKEITDKIESIKYVDSVMSMVSTDYIEGIDGGIDTFNLGDDIPTDEEGIQLLKKRLFGWDMYKDNLYSPDYKSASMVVDLEINDTANEIFEVPESGKSIYISAFNVGNIKEPRSTEESGEDKGDDTSGMDIDLSEFGDFADFDLEGSGFGEASKTDLDKTCVFTYSIDGTEYEAVADVDGKITGEHIRIGKIDFGTGRWNIVFKKALDSGTKLEADYIFNIITPQHKVIHEEINSIIDEYDNEKYDFHMSGMPSLTVNIGKYMNKDLMYLIPLVIIVVLLILTISFQRIGGVVLPILTVTISTIWAMGAMSLFGKNITIISTATPVILIAVGSAYGIHIITHYYEEMQKRKGTVVTHEEHYNIIAHIFKVVGMPVFLAALTTSIGFLSLLASPIVALRDFGFSTSIGVFTAFIVSVILIPSILLLQHRVKTDKSANDENGKEKVDMMAKVFIMIYHFLDKKKYRLIMIFVVMVIISIYGITKIKIDSQVVKYFKDDSPVSLADQFLNEKYAGTNIINITVKGKEAGDLAHPDILKAMDDLSIYLENKYDNVGKVFGFHSLVKRMNQVMHYPDDDGSEDYIGRDKMIELMNEALIAADKSEITVSEFVDVVNKNFNYMGTRFDEIPFDPEKYDLENKQKLKELITQYLSLYSGEVDSFADDAIEPKIARMSVITKDGSAIFSEKIIKDIEYFTKANFPDDYEVTTAGSLNLQLAVNELVVKSQVYSLIISLFIVFLIVAVSYKSIVAGIIGSVPLSLTIAFNFGVMGLLGIELNIGTAIIASIAIGTGIDYTIHFMSSYHHYRKETDNLEEVTKKTLVTSGKAIVFNATSVGLGFAVLLFSNFKPLVNLGFLVALAMFTASIGAMTLLPVIFEIVKPKFLRR